MEDKLKEGDDKEKQIDYESFDTEEENQSKNKRKKNYFFPIISILGVTLFLVLLLFFFNEKKSSQNKPAIELSKETKCLTNKMLNYFRR